MPKKTKTTKSSKEYYDLSPDSKKKKDAYQKDYNKKPEQRQKRSELVKANRDMQKKGKGKVGDGKDVSHTKNGVVLKKASTNRGSKSDMPGDRKARAKKK